MRRIYVWVFEGCSVAAFMGPIDVLTVANAVWVSLNSKEGKKVKPLFQWRLESPDGRPVRSASGYTVQVDGAIGTGGHADAVLVPALFANDLQGLLETTARLKPLAPVLRAEHDRGAVIAGACTASFILADAGLLEGRKATVHWAFATAFRRMYPGVELVPEEMLTEQDGIVCSAGTAYMRLALRLVEKFAGEGLAAATGERLVIDANRAPRGAPGVPTLHDVLAQRDPLVTRAQRWMQKRLQTSFQLGDLASELGVSERTISRRFSQALGKTPIAYLQTLRIETGKRFLETTKMSVESVAEHVGYGDVNFFRRVFKRQTGLSPREYHHRFARRHSSA